MWFTRQDRPDCGFVRRMSQGVPRRGIAQQAGRACQCLEMGVAGHFWSQQQIDKIDAASVYGVKLDWRGKAREHRNRPSDRSKPRVRNGNALSDPGASKTLAVLQGREELRAIKLGKWGRDARKLIQ
jgi:hypothetical protein